MAPLSVHFLEQLEVSARKVLFVRQAPINLYLAHQATIVQRINWTRNLESVQLVIIAMEAQSIVTQSTKPQVISVQRVTTVQLKVHTQRHAYQVPMPIQNSISSRTIVKRVYLAHSVQLMDLIIQVEIVLKDSTVLLERQSRVHQTRSVSLVTSALREVDFTTHVQLERINHIQEKDFATHVLLEAIVIPMKQDRTHHVWEMILVESFSHQIAQLDISALMVPNGPTSIHALLAPSVT